VAESDHEDLKIANQGKGDPGVKAQSGLSTIDHLPN